MIRFIVRLAGALAIAALSLQPALAQEPAVLQGRVLDGTTGEPLIGAQVQVGGTDLGSLTDVDGRYRISLTQGTWDLSVVYLGYSDKLVTGVEVAPGRANFQDITLQPAAVEAEGIQVVISAAEERGSVIGALAHQQRSTNVVNGISAEEIAHTPASSAADAVTRISSASLVDGRYVYVRGLGERYSQAQLDGSVLPSPEPEKRVLPLDIFPASMIESLFTIKSYTADLPGDFAGGLVDIQTKDIPDSRFLTFTTGVGYSTNLSEHDLPGYRGGGLDWLGFDDGTRGLPDGLPQRIPATVTPAELAQFHQQFEGDFRGSTEAPGLDDVNPSLGLSFGDRLDWFGKDGGYLVGLSFSSSANARAQEEFFPSQEEGRFQYDYDTTIGLRESSLGAIGGWAIDPTPTSRLALKTIYTHSAEDEARFVTGPFDQSTTGFARISRFQFVERSLVSSKLTFEHKVGFLSDAKVAWDGSYALALRDEPDTRTTSFVASGPEDPRFFFNEAGNNSRFFSELTDHLGQAAVRITSQLGLFGQPAILDVGLRGGWRTREFAARRFAYEGAAPEVRELSADELFTSANIAAGDIRFLETTEPNDAYDARELQSAAFASLGFGLTDRLRLTAGVRVEGNRTEVDSFDPRTGSQLTALSADLSTVEPMPSLTLQWQPAEIHAVRAAVSRTIVRPQFRELAPFRYDSYQESTLGNPFLENGSIVNADLRWSLFPSLGEIVSVGGFYKRFADPIEIVRIPTSGTNLGTPEPYNAPMAKTYGVEIELRHDLGRWTPFDGLSVSANATVADSRVQQDEAVEVYLGGTASAGPEILTPEVFTNPERPLYGQSPYLLNVALSWSHGATDAVLLYNGVGERLAEVGTNGYDDIFEQARHTLDATVEQAVMGGVRLKLGLKNLTDAPYELRLGDDTTRKYEVGREVALKVSYSF
jgi:outer membrane receptor protein involved in Fe transport